MCIRDSDNAVYRLSTSLYVLEIIEVRFESCSKSHQNLDIFGFTNFKGAAPLKLYKRYYPLLRESHVAKFHKATPTTAKVIGTHLILSQLLSPLWKKKIVRGTPVFGGKCASKTWLCCSTCKNLGTRHSLGAETWFFQKVDLGGYDSTSRSPHLVDQSSPDLFC